MGYERENNEQSEGVFTPQIVVSLFKFHSHSYYVGETCLSLLSAHFSPRIVYFRKIGIGAIHIIDFTRVISHIVFSVFGCELRLF